MRHIDLPMEIVIAHPLENFENIYDNDGASMSTNVILIMKVSTYFREKFFLTYNKNFSSRSRLRMLLKK